MGQINRIEIILLKIPYTHPFRIALAVMDCAQSLIVRIQDGDGLAGVGEGCPASFVTGEAPETAFEAARLYARALLGKSPLEIDSRLRELSSFMVRNTAVRCAFDTALYDLLAKRANLPLYALLGGAKRVIRSNRTIGIASPDAMAATAEWFVRGGAVALKVKVGTGWREDVARVRAIRAAVGAEVALRLDANHAWDEVTAVAVLNDLAACDLQLCEQPLAAWNVDGLARVRARSPIAIMADESVFDHHDAHRLAALGAVDYFNIKLAKSGGLHGALKINAVAEAAGVQCMLGGMSETRLGVSAGAHLMCACPNITLADLDSPFHFAGDPILGGVDFRADGTVTLGDAPGIGAEVNPEWVARSQRVVVERTD